MRLEVDGRPCVAYPGLTGPVALGDDVLVNVQAVELGLGSGGFDVLHANLTRGLDLAPEEGAHVMKLPYTSLQHAVRHVGGAWAPDELSADLAGFPVVCCSLHSQVAPVCAGLGSEPAVAYVQLAGGALPVSLSRTPCGRSATGGYLRTTVCGRAVLSRGEVACVSTGFRAGRVRGWPGMQTSSSARSGPESSAPAPVSATVRWRPPTPRTRQRHSAGAPCSLRGSRRPTSASGTAASRTTRSRCWSSSGAGCSRLAGRPRRSG